MQRTLSLVSSLHKIVNAIGGPIQSSSQLTMILKEHFGLSEFRPGQQEIIQSVLSGRDTLAVMPTGGGKSLCYQLPALAKPGITLVISPLVALMNDQVAGLRRLGLPAGAIHSGLSEAEKQQVFQDLRASDHYLLYISPERVQKIGFHRWFREQKINLVAIDEAHCISQWGHDFRTSYAQLSLLKEMRPDCPILALTATATELVKRDILDRLKLEDPAQFVHGFYRPNLYLQVVACDNDQEKKIFLHAALRRQTQGRILIYSGTRQRAEDWADFCGRHEQKVGFYHAGLPTQQRQKVEEAYRTGEIRILTATNAFGMGIDHPDVRLVVHTELTSDLESYYQEMGRAGRDGQPSTCLLLHAKKDRGLQGFFINKASTSRAVKNLRWSNLEAMVEYGEKKKCRHHLILKYFTDQSKLKKCGHCDICAPRHPQKVSLRGQLSEASLV